MRFDLLVTSCNRHDLLKRTLESFTVCAKMIPVRTVIVEDSNSEAPSWFRDLGKLGTKVWLNNGERMGQAYSVSRLIDEASSDYAFWLEDDWDFVQQGFMQPSFDILTRHPEIIQVSLRGNDCNGHPIIHDGRYGFKIQEPNWKGGWGGWSFNPSVVRVSDLKRVQPIISKSFFQSGLGCELELSKQSLAAGNRIAVLPRVTGTYEPWAIHSGGGRSKAIEKINNQPPKILIAVPACWKFEYGRWESEESPRFKGAKGSGYGKDIHISGRNDRISAVLDTWWRDIAPFSHHVTGRFFYGKPVPEVFDPARLIKPGQTATLFEDSVVLDVPDDYAHLPHKTNAICKWALDHGFQYLLKVDDDTLVYVDRAVREVVANRFDYAGYAHAASCTGGPGYWLSARAMRAVVESGTPQHWAEDMNVGGVMGRQNIKPTHLVGHKPGFSDHWFWPEEFDATKLDEQIVTAHAVQPEMMRKWWEYKNGH
jgi:hypothetical protein